MNTSIRLDTKQAEVGETVLDNRLIGREGKLRTIISFMGCNVFGYWKNNYYTLYAT